MTYRLAKALETLRDDVNAAAPVRNRQSDGWIGDASHASRSSDHNPWVRDNNVGVVTALDITHDPQRGMDGAVLSEALIKDPRVKYVIWNRRIWNPDKGKVWRPYKGTNPHNHHVHVSVLSNKAAYDSVKHWDVGVPKVEPPVAPGPLPVAERPRQKLRLGMQGGDVFELQRRLGIDDDGDFGPKTQAAVKAFQRANRLVVDGVVGPYTWEALDAKRPLTEPQGLVAPPPGAEVPGYGSPRWAVGYLEELGYSRQTAIAIVANLMWESGGHDAIDWDAHGDRGADGAHHSHGAAQWNDRHGRYQALLDYAKAHGTAWDDPATQLGYLNHELLGTEHVTAERLKNATSLDEAMEAALGFWRPSIPHAARRKEIAAKLKNTLDGGNDVG